MRRRHSRMGEQNEQRFWQETACSVWERIRKHPDGARSTHLPGSAALWVLPASVLRYQHARPNTSPFGTTPKPGVTICPVSPGQYCFTSVIPESLLVSLPFHSQKYPVWDDKLYDPYCPQTLFSFLFRGRGLRA